MPSALDTLAHICAARTGVRFFEFLKNLEHVADIVRAWEAEATKHGGGDFVVFHDNAKRLGYARAHLSDGKVFAGHANRLADEFVAALEYRVGAFANVFDSNT